MKKNYTYLPILVGLSLLSWSAAHATYKHVPLERTYEISQNIIRGKVVAETGEAVVGASVSNVTIGSSTQTDENGNFELSGSVGNELRISMVGYTAKTVTVTGPQVNVTIVATDQNLDEV